VKGEQAIMKNRISRLLIFVGLLTALLFSSTASAYAAVDENGIDSGELTSMTEVIVASIYADRENLEKYHLPTDLDFEDLRLGKGVPVYDLKDGLLNRSELTLYPLYSHNDIVTFMCAQQQEGGLSVTSSTELVEEMDGFYRENDSAVVITDGKSRMIKGPDADTFVKDEMSVTDSNESGEPRQTEQRHREFLGAAATARKGLAYTEQLRPTRIQLKPDLVSFESVAAGKEDQQATRGDVGIGSDDSPVLKSASTGRNPLNVPIVTQGRYGICWAASAASIGQYFTNQSVSPQTISYGIKGSYDGGNAVEVQSALRDYFRYPGTYTGVSSHVIGTPLPETEIHRYIDNGLPFSILCWTPDNGAMNHVVTVRGYATSATGIRTLSIVNSGTGAYETATRTSNPAIYLFMYNSVGYAWTDWTVVPNAWQKVDDRWRYFNNNGTYRTGWQSINGYRYCFNTSGQMLTGWQKISGYWYYFNGGDDGSMRTGWSQVGSKWYYHNGSGQMLTGWQKIGSYWYYFNGGDDGSMRTGWSQVGSKWYYHNGSGQMLTGWQKIGSYWYSFYGGSDGSMRIGWYKDGSSWYYLRTATNVPRSGPHGAMLVSTSASLGGKTYYFNSSGICTNP
jgi:glucan-binding YG repeat protein